MNAHEPASISISMGWFDGRAGVVAIAVLALCCTVAAVLARRDPAVRAKWLVGLALALAALAAFAGWTGRALDADEAEHLHSSWMVSQGLVPYVDFWQHHPPTTWLLLSPILGRFPHSAAVIDFGRGLSLAVSLAAWALALALACRLHGWSRGVGVVMAVLWAGAIIPGEFYNLRPDLFANLLSMLAILLLVRSRGGASLAVSGALLGLSASFTPKHLIFAALLPVVLLSERPRVAAFVKSVASYAAGIVLGGAPLILYLSVNGLLRQYWFWVYRFNGGDKLVAGGLFPIVPVALVVMWAVRRRANRWRELDPAERMVFVAVILSTVTMFFYKSEAKFLYNLQMFMILASALGTMDAKLLLGRLVDSRRAWVAGLAVGVYLISSVQAWEWLTDGDYYNSRSEVAALIRLSDGMTVVSMTPRHAIFVRDATRLHMAWQWNTYMWSNPVNEVLKGTARQIMDAPPAVIMAGEVSADSAQPGAEGLARVYFQGQLRNSGVATEQEAAELDSFLNNNYRLVRINHWYWVRNDIARGLAGN